MYRRVAPAKEAPQQPSFDFSFAQEGYESSRIQQMAGMLPEVAKPSARRATSTVSRYSGYLPRSDRSSVTTPRKLPPATQRTPGGTGFGSRRDYSRAASQPAPRQPPSPASSYGRFTATQGVSATQGFNYHGDRYGSDAEEGRGEDQDIVTQVPSTDPFTEEEEHLGTWGGGSVSTQRSRQVSSQAVAQQRAFLGGPSRSQRGYQLPPPQTRQMPATQGAPQRTGMSYGGSLTAGGMRERLRKAEELEKAHEAALGQVTALSEAKQSLEDENRQLKAKNDGLEIKLQERRANERALAKKEEIKTKEFIEAFTKVQASSKNLRAKYESAKETMAPIADLRTQFSAHKKDTKECRNRVVQVGESLTRARETLKSLGEDAAGATKLAAELKQQRNKSLALESSLKTEQTRNAELVKDKETLHKVLGGSGESFAAALKGLTKSGLLSPNVIESLKAKIQSLEDENKQLYRDHSALERERDTAQQGEDKALEEKKAAEDKAVKEVVAIQQERDVYKKEAASLRDQLKEKEINFKEAMAASNAATAAVQIRFTEAIKDKEAALQQLELFKTAATEAKEAKAAAEAVAAERATRIADVTAEVERRRIELDQFRASRSKNKEMATKYNSLEEKLAVTEDETLKPQRHVTELQEILERRDLEYTTMLAERDHKLKEATAARLDLNDFIARAERNKLTDDEKALVKYLEDPFIKRAHDLENKIKQFQAREKSNKGSAVPDKDKDTATATTTKPAAKRTYKRKRVPNSPVSTARGSTDDEANTPPVTKKATALAPASRGRVTRASKTNSVQMDEPTLEDLVFAASISLSPAPEEEEAPTAPPPPSQHPRGGKTRRRL